MGLDRIFYIPVFNTPKVSEPKGNGSKVGRSPNKSDYRPNDLGISYRDGIGCELHDNCFACTEFDCRFSDWKKKDRKHYANRGDGIKVW